MGNSQSTIYWKICNIIPLSDSSSGWWDSKQKPFEDLQERDQFIHAVITVITRNGSIDLREHQFRLLYSRRSKDNSRIVARIVAQKNGVIVAKIEPQADGKDNTEAFIALKKDVEVQLDRILEHVSTADGVAGPSKDAPPRAPPVASSSIPQDAPPAYSAANAKVPKGKKG